MKIQITWFSGLLVFGMALLMVLLWCASLMVLIDQQNRQSAIDFQQNHQSQLLQLQQKQRLWLQSQFYLLSSLAESGPKNQSFQSFVWDYYQRNPDIWAVNLVHFDPQGAPLSRSARPGCLQPQQMNRSDFEDFLIPRLSVCRIDDKALLEIAGPVSVADGTAVLLVSMDYFGFLKEFSTLTQRKLQRNVDSSEGIQYQEFSSSGDPGRRVTLPLGDAGDVQGQLHLIQEPLSFWKLFQRQASIVVVVLFSLALLVFLLLYFQLIKPLLRLTEKMRSLARNPEQKSGAKARALAPGLKLVFEYFKALQKMAKRDPLTGLNNRVIFEDRLLQAIREGKRNARRYALVLVEVFDLGDIAHRQGQYIADALLKQASERLRAGLRETDHIARFDQQMFAILLEVREQDQLISLVEKIYLSLSPHYEIYGRDLEISCGLGVAIYPDQAIDAESLYQHASSALVDAKASEWPIIFFKHIDDITDISGFTLVQALRRAIDNEKLKLVYQPVVDLVTYETIYFEALLRWKDPHKHDASIEKTIHLAEQNQLIKPLTNWIIETACRFISESDIANLSIGVNLSMIDLHDRQLPERIETYLQRYGVKPAQIVIEITEGQIMQEPENVIEVLSHLGVMGLSLSIDDFGTGQASLTYLKDLPVEKLKIDQSFVSDLVINPDDQLIVKATIELAHTLDLKVIAEGVESNEVFQMLADLNCDYVQGYYISRPLEAEQLSEWHHAIPTPARINR